ncbi:MAG: YraN family protein [Candidatus Paceibacterota bacterium]
MTYKSQLGKFGENTACQHLIKKGYKILERNFRKPWGELDIIAKAPDKTLVFIEVKAVSGVNGNLNGIQPEEQLTKTKLRKFRRTASLYAGHLPEKIDDEKGWRIDLLALTITPKDCLINHYENIC